MIRHKTLEESTPSGALHDPPTRLTWPTGFMVFLEHRMSAYDTCIRCVDYQMYTCSGSFFLHLLLELLSRAMLCDGELLTALGPVWLGFVLVSKGLGVWRQET